MKKKFLMLSLCSFFITKNNFCATNSRQGYECNTFVWSFAVVTCLAGVVSVVKCINNCMKDEEIVRSKQQEQMHILAGWMLKQTSDNNNYYRVAGTDTWRSRSPDNGPAPSNFAQKRVRLGVRYKQAREEINAGRAVSDLEIQNYFEQYYLEHKQIQRMK